MSPSAGSAYSYARSTMGELVGWIIGWDLVLEYCVGAATVAQSWSSHLNELLQLMGGYIPVLHTHTHTHTHNTISVNTHTSHSLLPPVCASRSSLHRSPSLVRPGSSTPVPAPYTR